MNLSEIKPQRQVLKKSRIKKVFTISCVVVGALVVALLMAIPLMIMGDMVNLHIDFNDTNEAEDFGLIANRLDLTTSDEIHVVGYEVCHATPKAVVIFLSGIHSPSVTSFYGHAKLMQDHDYASILLEMRSHGESEGEVISLGYKEYLDVEAVVDYIKASAQYNNIPIVVYGLSMGGATAINAIGEISDIDALISMSAYSSWEDVFCENMANSGVPKAIAMMDKPFVKLYSTFKFGIKSFAITPEKEIKKIGNRPALLIHSRGDSQVPYTSFERLLSQAPEHVETFTREGDFHFIVKDEHDFNYPQNDEAYSQCIIEFLDKHFDGQQH